MLTIENLTAGYPDGGAVLDGVSLALDDGECVAVMGRNGMGKTTLLRTIMGHLRPTAGRIVFAGQDVTRRSPFAISNLGIAYVPQGREIFPHFTVEENLLMGVVGKPGLPAVVPASVYDRFPILGERRRQKAGTMSGGEQQQLAFARAVVGRPKLLLLDEPSEGIQPSIVQALAAAAAAIAREDGVAILLVEQNLELVRALTTRCLFMENGRIVDAAATADLAADRSKLERYLSV